MTPKLTPFQRGLLNGLRKNSNGGLAVELYEYLKPQPKRSLNLLIKRGYVVLSNGYYRVSSK